MMLFAPRRTGRNRRRSWAARASGAGLVMTLVVTGSALAGPDPAVAAASNTTLISASRVANQAGNGPSLSAGINASGRFVAFESDATDLVARDTNAVKDMFVRDRRTRTTSRISMSFTGGEADGVSYGRPSMSADGRYVAFTSEATNLVPGDTNGTADVFVRDTRAGVTTRVGVSSTGAQANGHSDYPSMSADGRYVAFASTASNLTPDDTNAMQEVFVRDLVAGTTSLISVAYLTGAPTTSYGSYWQSISANGRYVVFASWKSNLVPGDTNETLDVFVRDRLAGTTIRASLSDSDQEVATHSNAPSISDDGRLVAFASEDAALVAGDTNNASDVFVRDVVAGTTRRISVSASGAQGLTSSSDPAITPNGRYVAFNSAASNLVRRDTNGWWDVFIRDLWTGRMTLLSVSRRGVAANFDSANIGISADGRHAVFNSWATNLAARDTNGDVDVFVRDWSG